MKVANQCDGCRQAPPNLYFASSTSPVAATTSSGGCSRRYNLYLPGSCAYNPDARSCRIGRGNNDIRIRSLLPTSTSISILFASCMSSTWQCRPSSVGPDHDEDVSVGKDMFAIFSNIAVAHHTEFLPPLARGEGTAALAHWLAVWAAEGEERPGEEGVRCRRFMEGGAWRQTARTAGGR